ncbi:MAG: polyprenyl synthetase family protein [Archaeoglobaceae archaeon]|nr:polyprenyl synthetase family protein [Archaeoglobaceae archaeon]
MIENWEEYLVFEKELRRFVEVVEVTPKIKKALKYVIFAGGKRIRPLIVLLSGKICDGDYRKLIGLAIAVELIHTASLVHDDVIDRAKIRRNRTALHVEYDPALAIVFGDWLISKSVELTSNYGKEIVEESARVGMIMSEGEILDYYSTKDFFTEKDYFECIEKKTASLFAYSAKIACKIVSKDDIAIQKLYEYGYNLGMAYQMVDDLLEYVNALKDKNSEFESLTLPQIYANEYGKEVAIEKVLSIIRDFSIKSISSLSYFQDCEEKKKLETVVRYMTENILNRNGLLFELPE